MADQNIKVKIDLDLAEFNKHAKELSNAISNVLGKDVDIFNGKLKQTAKDTDKATEAFGRAGAAAGKTGSSVKKSNQQWTNFALILQDLPYGFRGIQNNLPAVIGSFAGMTGPIYLATSAIIAFFTALDSGLISFGKSTKEAENFTKQFGTTLTQETIKYQSLYRVATDVNTSMNERIKAAATLKKEYPGLLTQYSEEEIALGKAKTAFDKLSSSIIKYAKAQAATSIITDLTKEQLIIEGKRAELLDKFVKDPLTNYSKAERANMKGASPYNVALNYRVNILKQLATQYNDLQKKIDVYTKVLDKNVTAEEDLNKFKDDEKKGAKEKVSTSALDNLKTQQNIYKDDLDMFFYYGSLIINEEERIAKERARIEGTLGKDLINIESNYEGQRIINKQEFGRKIMEQAEKNTKSFENSEKESNTKILNDTKSFYDNLKLYASDNLDQQIVNLGLEQLAYDQLLDLKIISDTEYANKSAQIYKDLNDIKNKQDTALYRENIKNVELALQQTLKATRGNYNSQKEAYQLAIDKLTEKKAALDAAGKSTVEYANAIKNLEAGMGGLIDPVEQLNQSLQATMNQLQVDLLTNFGEQLGEMIAGGEFDFSKLGTILADGLASLGKALIAFALTSAATIELFKDPKKWPLALAAGITAVAAGAALKGVLKNNKATAFANGGIVSGPTMGLVGEYPGAANNPEVIAPLDKLKSMIGGGGSGTFVLRGQDLLLSVNRAQKASNLKGQNISLA